MKKLLTVSLALLLVAVFTVPASAFIFVFAEIEKDKYVSVTERIRILKQADIDVTVSVVPEKAAETLALVNQENLGNFACEDCAEKTDLLSNSMNFHTGIMNANQSAGNENNQGNVLAVGVDFRIPPPPSTEPEPNQENGFANAEASVSQNQGFLLYENDEWNFTPDNNEIDSINILFREAIITASLNDNMGIVGFNQAPGQQNNQVNNLALAAALTGGVALSEADLGQHTLSGYVGEDSVYKTATITGSILRNSGIVSVNQSSGNQANQANNLSIAATLTVQ
jgi:hypothetical protein